jgi:hypothetical protein
LVDETQIPNFMGFRCHVDRLSLFAISVLVTLPNVTFYIDRTGGCQPNFVWITDSSRWPAFLRFGFRRQPTARKPEWFENSESGHKLAPGVVLRFFWVGRHRRFQFDGEMDASHLFGTRIAVPVTTESLSDSGSGLNGPQPQMTGSG